jgi:hypothetical protein
MQNPSGPAAMVGRPSIIILRSLRPLRRVRPGVERRASVCVEMKWPEEIWRTIVAKMAGREFGEEEP